MKQFSIFLILVLSFSTNTAIGQTNEILVDARDFNKYKTTKIGSQVWMAENLNFKTKESLVYNQKEDEIVFGRLYNWDEARVACPTGWHLPSDQEWKDLEKLLGMTDGEADKLNEWRGTDQGKRLISDSALQFHVPFGGYGNPPANFNLKNSQAFFWTSTTEYELVLTRQFYEKEQRILRKARPKNWSFSVRCIKD
ncbi:MAG: FISUMP domain-containing protein [Bacteroidales bacterium]